MKPEILTKKKHKTSKFLSFKISRWVGFIGAVCSVIAAMTYFINLIKQPHIKTPIIEVNRKILKERGVSPEVSLPNLEQLKGKIHPTSYDIFKAFSKCKDPYLLDKIYEIEKSQKYIVSIIFFIKGSIKLKEDDLETAIKFFHLSLIHDPQNIISISYLDYAIWKKLHNLSLKIDYPSKSEWEEVKKLIEEVFSIRKKIDNLNSSTNFNTYLGNSFDYLSRIPNINSYSNPLNKPIELQIAKACSLKKSIIAKISIQINPIINTKRIHNNRLCISKFRNTDEKNKKSPIKIKSITNFLQDSHNKIYYNNFLTLGSPNKISNKCGTLISIGINKYASNQLFEPLKFAVSDAKNISSKLFLKGYSHVLLLNEKATKTNILNMLINIRNINKGNQPVLIYFAGHGICSMNGDRYLVCYSDKADDFLIPVDLIRRILSLNKGKTYGIFDTCFKKSNNIFKSDRVYNFKSSSIQNEPLILLASSSENSAYESDDIGSGLFTYILMQYLSKIKSQEIDFEEMYQHVLNKTKSLAQYRYNIDQEPIIYKTNSKD